jgi:protein tyrosine phosphatase (PTP) superfamily phosphohydrolase (DUF442 family)
MTARFSEAGRPLSPARARDAIASMPYRRIVAVLVIAAVAACGQSPRLLHPTDPATDFYEVSPGIYRGGRLDEAGVKRLGKLGIKTILNLESDKQAVATERAWAKATSITQISSPMSGGWTPNDRQVDELLATLADPAKHPIYVHCKKGMDRTGVIVALHRVFNENWTPKAAARERDAIGFNGWLLLLDRYYLRKVHARAEVNEHHE